MEKINLSTMVLILFLIIASNLFAAPNIVGKVETYKVEGETEVLLPENSEMKPGEIIKYSIRYDNIGDEDAHNVEFKYPISEGMTYEVNSVRGDGCDIMFTIDNGSTYQPEPVKYVVIDDNGNDKEMIAEIDQYNGIKWILQKPLRKGSSIVLTFKVKIYKTQTGGEK